MTGNEFIDQLRASADFLKPDELDSLVSFYENRLLKAKSADEEEKIVADFGSIELIVRKLKVEYGKLKNASGEETALKNEADPEGDFFAGKPSDQDDSPSEDSDDDDDVRIFGEDEQKNPPKKRRIPTRSPGSGKSSKPHRKYYGLANSLLDRINVPADKRKPVGVVLRVLFSPVFVLLTLLLILLYVAALAAIVAAAAVLGIVELALILVSVAELVYGIVMFLTSVPVALIELGLGTMLIGVVTAITALVYQLLTGVIPLAMKSITGFYLRTFRLLREIIFGSEAGGEKK